MECHVTKWTLLDQVTRKSEAEQLKLTYVDRHVSGMMSGYFIHRKFFDAKLRISWQ